MKETIQRILKDIHRAGLNGGAFVQPEIQKLFEDNGFHLSTTHYYSPIVSLKDARQVYATQRSYEFALKESLQENQWQLLTKLLRYIDELGDISRDPDGSRFHWNNPMFPPLDAIAYYGLIREFKPRRILEIGSGFSTRIALKASAHGSTSLTCIEPYPTEELLAISNNIELLRSRIEDVDPAIFSGLQEGDFLFVDTSHTVKIGSDVNWIVFDVLPRVPPGVWIHFHDIFLPYEYPSTWIEEIGIQWNEQYLVGALIMNNPVYCARLMNYWLSETYKRQLAEACRGLPIWDLTNNLGGARGASMWIMKGAHTP